MDHVRFCDFAPLASRRIEGLATRYLVPHLFKGKTELFMPGCFSAHLETEPEVKLLLRHEDEFVMGSTLGDLKLFETEEGLGFEMMTPRSFEGNYIIAAIESGELRQMSVRTRKHKGRLVKCAGEDAFCIERCELGEISMVRKGVVTGTFVRLAGER